MSAIVKREAARKYETLCNVLDALCAEAPATLAVYHPPSGDAGKITQARSRALIHLFLKVRFGLLQFADREHYVTDGPHDGGVDAYYIDKVNKKIYAIQSKFRANPGNFVGSNMSLGDLLKMDVKRIMDGHGTHENGVPYNQKILKGFQKEVKKLLDIASYDTSVIILGNLQDLTAGQVKKLIDGYPVEQLSHQKVYSDLLFPVINGTYYANPELRIEINLDSSTGQSHLNYNVTAKSLKSNIQMLFVPTQEIGRIMHTYKNTILKFNPRSFLELDKNPVNADIKESIISKTNNEFALFNNGITIFSDSTKISSDTGELGRAQVVITNPQLVNGGQTAYTLSRLYEEGIASKNFKIFKGKEVLLRIITFVGKPPSDGQRLELIGAVSKASNSQTKIEDADRRSNDKIQVDLQKVLFEKYGLYYERKNGEFSDGLHAGYISRDSIINREKLLRVCLASELRVNSARSSVKPFFSEHTFPTVFDANNAEKYAYGYEILNLLEQKRKEKPKTPKDRYHTGQYGQGLRYGQYAIVAACVKFGMPKHMLEKDVLEKILGQWKKFEADIEKKQSNLAYSKSGSFDYVNYYKGATINQDVSSYQFVVKP